MQRLSRWTNRPLAAVLPPLIILILLAYGLRLHNLDAYSFWTDEGLTPLRSGYSLPEILSNRIIIQEGVSKDTHPAFYYLLVHFTQQLFGTTDFAFRYPSLLAGVLLAPLLFQFGRRLNGIGVGLLAALLTAINPLQIYYAGEARMYTLFVLLMAGASYLLWRALQGAGVRQYLLLYMLLAGLAFYTHYTAVFLIAAQSVFWIWILWREGYRKLLAAAAALAILIAIPVIPFTLPRLFSGAEANYYYVPPRIMMQDVLHFFGMGMTTDFRQWLIKLLDLLMLALLLIGFWAAKPWRKRAFLLVYLLAVVLGLMAGSLLKPMYQGVRHIMVGSPAFMLLLAIGMEAIGGYLIGRWKRAEKPSSNSAVSVLAGLAGIVLLLTPIAAAIIALNNLYNDPDYAKGDYRGLIAYIERRAGDNDVILYNDAVMLPTHAHYQTRSDMDLTALPIYPYAVDAGLDGQMRDLVDRYDRIWFVGGLPADGRDSKKQVEAWLEARLPAVDRYHISHERAAVSTVGYGTAEQVVSELPRDAVSLDIAWPDLPVLRGIEGYFGEAHDAPVLWFDLFWDGDRQPPRDTILRFVLRGPDGDEWLRSETRAARNSDAWPAQGMVRQSYKLTVPPGTPPGEYDLLAQPIGPDGATVGDAVKLSEVEIAASERTFSTAPGIVFDNGLILQEIELYDTAVRPGHNLPLNLYWQIPPEGDLNLAELRYIVEVIGPGGMVLREQQGSPGADWLESGPAGATLREKTSFYFYPETEPGRYNLRWRLEAGDETVAVRPSWRPWSGDTVTFGAIDVEPWPLERDLPGGMTPSGAEFGPAIQLAGYEIGAAAEGALPIRLIWQASASPAASYLVFVHLLDEAGNIISQTDRVPVDGLRPTSGWRPGEVLSDNYLLPLPAELEPGNYNIHVGLYNPDDGQRLPVTAAGVLQEHNQLPLATVTLP